MHQLIGVQAALHEAFDLPLLGKLGGKFGSMMAMVGVENASTLE